MNRLIYDKGQFRTINEFQDKKLCKWLCENLFKNMKLDRQGNVMGDMGMTYTNYIQMFYDCWSQ